MSPLFFFGTKEAQRNTVRIVKIIVFIRYKYTKLDETAGGFLLFISKKKLFRQVRESFLIYFEKYYFFTLFIEQPLFLVVGVAIASPLLKLVIASANQFSFTSALLSTLSSIAPV